MAYRLSHRAISNDLGDLKAIYLLQFPCPFKWDFSYSCAADADDKILTDIPCRAVPLRQLSYSSVQHYVTTHGGRVPPVYSH